MIKIIKVTGSSLSPSFLSGDYVVIHTSTRKPLAYSKGDIVVANHPVLGLIIKRVACDHSSSQALELEGTHPDSISSEIIGLIPYQDVLGKVLWHIKHPR